jgi:hypothetical protein
MRGLMKRRLSKNPPVNLPGAEHFVLKQGRPQERREVVDLKGLLEAVFRQLSLAHDAASVVRKNVDAVVTLKLGSESSHVSQPRVVGDVERRTEFASDSFGLPRAPQPKPVESDAATVAAIKAALDERSVRAGRRALGRASSH